MSADDLVVTEQLGGVAVLRLNVPSRRNVLSGPLVRAIGTALDILESDGQTRSLVVTGAGSAFCAGAELSTLQAAADGDFDLVREVYDGFLRILHSPLVTIAAVNGAAVGAGFNLALACDVRLAAASASFDTRFARLRIHPGGGHVWMLARAVGAQQATMATLFGQVWDAASALEVGLVAALVPDGEVVGAAVELGHRIDDQDLEYVRRLIGTVRGSLSILEHGNALAAETEAQEWSTTRPDFRRGVEEVLGAVANRAKPVAQSGEAHSQTYPS